MESSADPDGADVIAPSADAFGSGDAPVLGVLGGSGLYDFEGLADVTERQVDTPFGLPSGPVVIGRIAGARVAFMARHGRGHRLSPSEINYRANIHALRQVGVRRLLSISAVGSLREGIPPGDLVLPDQFIDKTFRRPSTFFGDGIVGHVAFADPVCAELGDLVTAAAVGTGCVVAAAQDRLTTRPTTEDTSTAAARAPRLHRGGTYVCMEGPQFSTRAESLLHRSWGADVIGMTAVTEAKLAREAEMCFALMALSTDFDCWHPGHDAVTAGSVFEVLRANISRAGDVVRALVRDVVSAPPASCGCGRAAEHAILTAPEAVVPEARERLRSLYGRYL